MGHLTRTSGGEFSWGTPQLALSVTPHERPVARAGSGGLSHSVTDLDVAEPCIASRCAVRARNRRLDPTTGSHLFTLGDRRWSPATRAAPPICAAARSFSTAARVTQNQRLCRPSGLCFGMQALINLSRNRVGQSGTWPNMNTTRKPTMVKVMPTHWNGHLAMKIQASPRSPRLPRRQTEHSGWARHAEDYTRAGNAGPLPDGETQGLVVLVICSHIIRRCGSVTGGRPPARTVLYQ